MPALAAVLCGVPAGVWAQSQPATRAAQRAQQAFQQGVKAEQAGRTDEARGDYERAVALDAACGPAWYALGKIQRSRKELDAARKSFDAAIRAQPSQAAYYFELAGLEQGAQKWKSLIEIGERLVRVNATDYPEAYLLCATGYFKSGDLEKAEERAKAGEKIDTRQQFPKLHELLGWIQVERGNAAGGAEQRKYFQAAAGEFRQYLKLAPPDAHSAEIEAALNQIEGRPATAAAAPSETPSGAPAESAPQLTLRSTVTLIQVDVVAKDRNGKPIEDLRQEEFSVTDNGKPRQIATFTMEKVKNAERTAPAPPTAPQPARPNAFNNRIGEGVGRTGYSVILMDWFNTGVPNMQRVRQDALKALRGLEPNGRIALYSLDIMGLKVVNEFGASQADIAKSIGSVSGLAHPCHAMQLTEMNLRGPVAKKSRTQSTPETLCDDPDIPKQQAESLMRARIRDTMNALDGIADHLSGVPGRKSLVWISAGVPTVVIDAPVGPSSLGPQTPWEKFGEEFAALFRKLNNAGVSVYPVDARGLPAGQLYDDPRFPGSAMIQFTAPAMDEFASRTGGTAFYGRNNLDDGIRQALEDSNVTYFPGYYAPQDEPNRGTHKIAVKVNREGVKLRYREGYSMDHDAGAPEDRNAPLTRAALAALNATAIPFEVTASRKLNALTLRISVRPGALGLAHGGGRWRGSIDVATGFVTEKPGTSFPLDFETTELDLSEERYAEAERDGLLFPKTLEISAGADRIKVLIRSGASGKVGSVSIGLKEVAID